MESELVTAEQHTGPFGAKGLGESGTFGVSPAIANAIHDAVGVRITELPITAEAVLRALRAKEGRPLAATGAVKGLEYRVYAHFSPWDFTGYPHIT